MSMEFMYSSEHLAPKRYLLPFDNITRILLSDFTSACACQTCQCWNLESWIKGNLDNSEEAIELWNVNLSTQ